MSCGIDGEFCQAERLEQIEHAYNVLYEAIVAMVHIANDGELGYRTENNVPMRIPRRIQRRIRAALLAHQAVMAMSKPDA